MGNTGFLDSEKESSDDKHKAADTVAVFLMNFLRSCFMGSVFLVRKVLSDDIRYYLSANVGKSKWPSLRFKGEFFMVKTKLV